MRRRQFLSYLVALAATAPALLRPTAARAQAEADGQPFDWEWLKAHARRLASEPYRATEAPLPAALAELTYDQYQDIRFRKDRALWRDRDLAFRLRLFHRGLFFRKPVALHEVVSGVARPVPYSPDLFDFGGNRFDPPLPPDLGFAGFRVHHHTDWERDMVAFLGASYFRAVGGTKQYGVSARGLAIDTGLPRPEEFPDFRAFWIEQPEPGQTVLNVHALLDGESVAGAYRFAIRPGRTTVMDVDAALFPRRPIERVGIAPLTSMYLHGENDHRVFNDFRPEIHDSDGLQLWTGAGEWIWRPLVNPPELRVNAFLDENPRGFGLLQRDGDFTNYQDDGAYYNRRPNLWVEPRGAWGRGAVHLVEIPTPDETFDNIVTFWSPAEPVAPGTDMELSYRLHWGSEVPHNLSPMAKAVATRIGIGGIPGQPGRHETRKFVVDFVGGDLGLLAKDAAVEPVITVSRGGVEEPAARPIEELSGWRTNFDLRVDGTEPVNLRLFLRLDETALTETWSYQWLPPAV